MKQQLYESLIADLERRAAHNPKGYRLTLGAMAMLGYGYIAMVLLLLLGLVAVLVWRAAHGQQVALDIKFALVLGVLAWAVIRAMFVKLEPPQGREITASEASELMAEIARLRDRIDGPRVYKVLMDDQFNAAVVQHSRYGVFGGTRNYLVLGLPLMQALSLEEFRAVLAHEFGHLSAAHGKFGAWIYRLRLGWARLAASLEESEHWGRHLFVPFFDWYAPKFAAYSFVQARRQEYEADDLSAQVAGAPVAGAALVRVNLLSRFFEGDFWQAVFRAAQTRPQPDLRPFESLQSAFVQSQRTGTHSDQSLAELLRLKTGFDDTHPCLRERLSAMGVTPSVPAPFETSAADVLLGRFASQLAREFDESWQRKVSHWWQERQKFLADSREELSRLEAAATSGELSAAQACRRAELAEQLGDAHGAAKQLEALVTREPEHAPALLALGRLKLAAADESGIALLDRAMEHDAACRYDACRMIIDFLYAHGRNEEAHPFVDRLKDAMALHEQARRDRAQVHPSDNLTDHAYSAEQLAALVEGLREFPVRKAYLVKKIPKYLPEQPMHVLAVARKVPFWKFESGGASQELAAALVERLPLQGDSLVICLDSNTGALRRRLKRIPTALVHPA